ncbi:MAG: tetratricopeptide repeat protein [Arcobacteraceae bacterium]
MKIVLSLLLFLNLCFANTFNDALEAYQKEDYTKAFGIFEKLANEGNASAQYNLGVLYYYGDGVAVDKKKAYTLLVQAADQGHEEAQISLDTICEEEPSVCQ